MDVLAPKKLRDDVKEYLNKFDLTLCLTCGTCSNGCPITGTPGMEGWDTRKVIRMLSFGLLDEVVNSKFPGCARDAAGARTPAPWGLILWPFWRT